MPLNGTQKQMLDAIVSAFYLDLIKESEHALEALDIASSPAPLDASQEKQLREWDVLMEVRSLRRILQHPFPQNPALSNPDVIDYLNDAPEAAKKFFERVGVEDIRHCQKGHVVYTTGMHYEPEKFCREPAGLLGLTSRNDGTAEPVTTEDVRSYVLAAIDESKQALLSPEAKAGQASEAGKHFKTIMKSFEDVTPEELYKLYDDFRYGDWMDGKWENGIETLAAYSRTFQENGATLGQMCKAYALQDKNKRRKIHKVIPILRQLNLPQCHIPFATFLEDYQKNPQKMQDIAGYSKLMSECGVPYAEVSRLYDEKKEVLAAVAGNSDARALIADHGATLTQLCGMDADMRKVLGSSSVRSLMKAGNFSLQDMIDNYPTLSGKLTHITPLTKYIERDKPALKEIGSVSDGALKKLATFGTKKQLESGANLLELGQQFDEAAGKASQQTTVEKFSVPQPGSRVNTSSGRQVGK